MGVDKLRESNSSNRKGISEVVGVGCRGGDVGGGGTKVLGNRKGKRAGLIPGHSIEPSNGC